MADRIVMGYWDCPYCDEKGILGTSRECPHCGKPRGSDTKFYMKSRTHEEVVENGEYVSREQARKKGKGADWLCSYCGSYNPGTEKICKGCGHERDEEDKSYFEVKKEQMASSEHLVKQTPDRKMQPVKPAGSKKKSGLVFFIGLAGVLFWLGVLVYIGMPKTKSIVVLEKLWEYNVNVEKYQHVQESDWELPEKAEEVTSKREVHHYRQVLDHYETKTRTYQERVQSGSHTEYTYSDNGDGTFTEHAHTVPDYEYVTKTEEYQDPVYISVPVYKKKYYYKIWRWKPFRDVTTSGKNNDPYFGELKLKDKEREGEKTKKYSVKARKKDKEEKKVYTVTEEMWKKIRVDKEIKVKMSGGKIVELVE